MAGVAAAVEPFLLMAAFALHMQCVIFARYAAVTAVMAVIAALVTTDMVAKVTTVHPLNMLQMIKRHIAQTPFEHDFFRHRQGRLCFALRHFIGRKRDRDPHQGQERH